MLPVLAVVPVDVTAVDVPELVGDGAGLLRRAEAGVHDDALGPGVGVSQGPLPGGGAASGNLGLLVAVAGLADPVAQPLKGAGGRLPWCRAHGSGRDGVAVGVG